MTRQDEDRSAWRPFIEDACAAVGVDPARVDEDLVLGLVAQIAHRSVRPMAPVGAYILGVALGQQGPGADLAALADRLRDTLDHAEARAADDDSPGRKGGA